MLPQVSSHHLELEDWVRVTDKLDLISRIGRELQSRFGYSEIDAFLGEFGVRPPEGPLPNSKWVYAKTALAGTKDDIVRRIAEELDMDLGTSRSVRLPRNWEGTAQLRAFISHVSKDKDKATRLKACLEPYAVSGFVAHEDIHPTLEWQDQIERALRSMDVFIAMHTQGFSGSVWTQQEVGFAVASGAKIISLKMGEDPTGFISRHQALSRQRRTAEQIAAEIDVLLSEDDRTADRLSAAKRAELKPPPDDEIPF